MDRPGWTVSVMAILVTLAITFGIERRSRKRRDRGGGSSGDRLGRTDEPANWEAVMRRSMIVLVTAGSLGAMALVAPPASAVASGNGDLAASAAGCSKGAFCFYEHRNSRGKRFTLRTQDATFHDNPCDGCKSSKHPSSNDTWGDMASSYYNNSGETYCLYFHKNYDNLMFRINNRQRGNFGRTHNDELSSARPC